MVERTSLKLYPIVREVLKRMIEEKIVGAGGSEKVYEAQQIICSESLLDKVGVTEEADMRSVLGYLNQNEWIYR